MSSAAATSPARLATAPSGTVRKTTARGRDRSARTSAGTPFLAGVRSTRWPARRPARARLRPRLPRPATTKSVGLWALRSGGAGGGRDARLVLAGEDLVQLLRVEGLDD